MKKNYNGIQTLRFFAALLVVIMHAGLYVTERLNLPYRSLIWDAGSTGVDIFFVISGFVITLSSRDLFNTKNSWTDFLLRRIIRIVPLYWILTSLKIIAALAIPTAALHSKPELTHILLSYLFLPARGSEGTIFPYLGVGWTLNFEFLFYATFALGLAIKSNVFLFCATALLPLSLLAFIKSPDWPSISFYADPLVIEFLLGMFLAKYIIMGHKIDRTLGVILTTLGAALILFPPEFFSSSARLVSRGIPAFFLVSGVVAIDDNYKLSIPKWLISLGDSSYALYLTHPFLAPLPVFLFSKSDIFSPIAIQMALVIAAISIGLLAWLMIDKPIYVYLTRKYRTRNTPPAADLNRS